MGLFRPVSSLNKSVTTGRLFPLGDTGRGVSFVKNELKITVNCEVGGVTWIPFLRNEVGKCGEKGEMQQLCKKTLYCRIAEGKPKLLEGVFFSGLFFALGCNYTSDSACAAEQTSTDAVQPAASPKMSLWFESRIHRHRSRFLVWSGGSWRGWSRGDFVLTLCFNVRLAFTQTDIGYVLKIIHQLL